MASFYIPLSGLNADSTALNTIANDLSNMNTTAFKSQTTNFSNLFSQQIGSTGSGDEIQMGEGVQVASNETNYAQGSSETTANSTDMQLNGNGFFVLNDGGSNVLTRAGDFSLGSNGNLIGRHERDGLSGGERGGEHQCGACAHQYSGGAGGGSDGYDHLWDDLDVGFRGGGGHQRPRPGAGL
jgi:flagellar hook protein FlgE